MWGKGCSLCDKSRQVWIGFYVLTHVRCGEGVQQNAFKIPSQGGVGDLRLKHK
jgi:hypothetical protein